MASESNPDFGLICRNMAQIVCDEHWKCRTICFNESTVCGIRIFSFWWIDFVGIIIMQTVYGKLPTQFLNFNSKAWSNPFRHVWRRSFPKSLLVFIWSHHRKKHCSVLELSCCDFFSVVFGRIERSEKKNEINLCIQKWHCNVAQTRRSIVNSPAFALCLYCNYICNAFFSSPPAPPLRQLICGVCVWQSLSPHETFQNQKELLSSSRNWIQNAVWKLILFASSRRSKNVSHFIVVFI